LATRPTRTRILVTNDALVLAFVLDESTFLVVLDAHFLRLVTDEDIDALVAEALHHELGKTPDPRGS
jgi:hypothetical protein